MSRWLATTALSSILLANALAFETMPDSDAVQQAIAIGQSRLTQERERFHRAYRIMVTRAPVDYVEIVTPFRRIVLATEAKAAAGERGFGQREALEILAASRDQIDVYVELSFHPLNTFVGIPDYQVTLTRASDPTAHEAMSIDRIPRYGPRVSGGSRPVPTGPVLPGGSQPMLGGTMVAHFDLHDVDSRGTYDVVILDTPGNKTRPASELARARVEFATMR
jgi:hypothetical protein